MHELENPIQTRDDEDMQVLRSEKKCWRQSLSYAKVDPDDDEGDEVDEGSNVAAVIGHWTDDSTRIDHQGLVVVPGPSA